jgi:hypothetical protein
MDDPPLNEMAGTSPAMTLSAIIYLWFPGLRFQRAPE